MNISKVVKKVLSEQQTVTPVDKKIVIDDKNQGQILRLGLDVGCIPEGELKTMNDDFRIKYLPQLQGNNIPFVQVKNFIYTGQVNKEVSDSKEGTSFYAYQLEPGSKPQIVKEGWGLGCAVFMSVDKLGYSPLSENEYQNLQKFLVKNKNYSEGFKPDSNEYELINIKDLKWESGNSVIPNYNRGGYVWKRTSNVTGVRQDLASQAINMLTTQGITPDEQNADETTLVFYWGDIKDNFRSKPDIKDNTRLWVESGKLPQPEKNICRSTIKKLDQCRNSKTMIPNCYNNLTINKITAIQCADKRFVGGVIGIKDEYENLKNDRGPFGLFKLLRRIQNPTASILESIKSKISKKLNEEYKKRRSL
jgi:hypothetical protein